MSLISAPWTTDQINSLNAFQQATAFHEYTCNKCRSPLQATEEGWICPDSNCNYIQDWAHDFSADWSWKNPEKDWRELTTQWQQALST